MDELKDMIALLKRADFDPSHPTVIDTDLHKRVADAIPGPELVYQAL